MRKFQLDIVEKQVKISVAKFNLDPISIDESVKEHMPKTAHLPAYLRANKTAVDRSRFLRLSIISQPVLAIPATSAASERVFSVARLAMPKIIIY